MLRGCRKAGPSCYLKKFALWHKQDGHVHTEQYNSPNNPEGARWLTRGDGSSGRTDSLIRVMRTNGRCLSKQKPSSPMENKSQSRTPARAPGPSRPARAPVSPLTGSLPLSLQMHSGLPILKQTSQSKTPINFNPSTRSHFPFLCQDRLSYATVRNEPPILNSLTEKGFFSCSTHSPAQGRHPALAAPHQGDRPGLLASCILITSALFPPAR